MASVPWHSRLLHYWEVSVSPNWVTVVQHGVMVVLTKLFSVPKSNQRVKAIIKRKTNWQEKENQCWQTWNLCRHQPSSQVKWTLDKQTNFGGFSMFWHLEYKGTNATGVYNGDRKETSDKVALHHTPYLLTVVNQQLTQMMFQSPVYWNPFLCQGEDGEHRCSDHLVTFQQKRCHKFWNFLIFFDRNMKDIQIKYKHYCLTKRVVHWTC